MAAASIIPTLVAETPVSRPNIIHIMADDLGWRDLSIYGSETFQTPNIDALARNGIRFSNAYSASPLCSPTRASLLTGQSVARTNFSAPHGHINEVVLDPKESDVGHPGMPMTIPQSMSRLPLDSVTISQVLKDAGYRTAFIGKWHLGHAPHIPENFGFDVVVGGRGTPGPPAPGFFGPWPEEANFPPTEGNPNADDVMGDAAVKFIAENPEEQPFFMCLWLYNPHAPFQGVPEDIEGARESAESALYQRSAIMASMVKAIDDNVGKVMEELERRGLLENTVVFFTSDNGGNMYDRPEGENPTSNHPLRAGKGNAYEGGVRVPLIVSWPGKIAPNTKTDAVNISYDFFPTALEITRTPAPKEWPLDGVSMVPVLESKPFERGPIFVSFPHTVFATGNMANLFVRGGNWKLMRFFHTGPNQEDEFELYDLAADPGETRNLASAFPDVTKRLAATLEDHIKDAGTLLPRRNPKFDPNFTQAGFRAVQGGYIITGNEEEAGLSVKGPGLTLRYIIPADATPGDVLELDFHSNCAISVMAGPGDTPIFGSPVSVTPDLAKRRISLPLEQEVSEGEITILIDLEQPGRVHVGNAQLSQTRK